VEGGFQMQVSLIQNINEILNGTNTEIDFKNFNVNDLNKKYRHFNKLSNHQKTLVINRIFRKNS
jgi:hypothetical protein